MKKEFIMSQDIVLSHPIDPMIDYPFKLIFGKQENEPIILNFLNAVIQPKNEIVAVKVQNPFNDKEFENDKLTIVDIRVKDSHGATYHIEVQLITNDALKSRILYYWAKLYAEQLKSGEDYKKLKPVHSIWITKSSITDEQNYHNKVGLRFEDSNRSFIDHCQIHLLELNKLKLSQLPDNIKLPRDILRAWLLFLRDGNSWHKLPKPLAQLDIMRSTMQVLKEVSEQEDNYFRYLGRFQYKAQQLTIENVIKEQNETIESQSKEIETQSKEIETQSKEIETQSKVLEEQAEYIKQLESQLKTQSK